jgi:hypothetical protein
VRAAVAAVAAARVQAAPRGRPPGGPRVGSLPRAVPTVGLPGAVVRVLRRRRGGRRDGGRGGRHGGGGVQEDQGAPGAGPALVSRREHVSMRGAGGRGHWTCVAERGEEREISVDLVSRSQGKEKERDRADVGMSVSVDGDRVLHVRRLRWKFRGSEKVDLGGGDRVLVSWDLHDWLFPSRDASPPPSPAHAMFVFRFELGGDERDSAEVKGKELLDKGTGRGGNGWAGLVGRWVRGDWSESSSNGEQRRKRRQARRLAKESSSSSASSSASFASGRAPRTPSCSAATASPLSSTPGRASALGYTGCCSAIPGRHCFG